MAVLANGDHDCRGGFPHDDSGALEVWWAAPSDIVREPVRFARQSDEVAVKLSVAVDVVKDGDGIRPWLDVPDAKLDRALLGRLAIPVGACRLFEAHVANSRIDHAAGRRDTLRPNDERR